MDLTAAIIPIHFRYAAYEGHAIAYSISGEADSEKAIFSIPRLRFLIRISSSHFECTQPRTLVF